MSRTVGGSQDTTRHYYYYCCVTQLIRRSSDTGEFSGRDVHSVKAELLKLFFHW